ncbi:hypothetical protein VTN77DRAFT_1685 [Rasamsonia byssochlamydoides]|uniref:uncharacterized protein n=1 Tax=Rasamsonia byssochlamydoides TaxID=89139 RepID=UPI003741EE67
MPIKLPKGFTRRKSSGNALEEVENPPEPSFRVLERPGGGARSFESGPALKGSRPSTEDDNIFAGIEKPLPKNRGSGGTNHSTSTAGLYDSSSSARFSSSSTLPSSTDVPVQNDLSRTLHDIPVPPVPESSSLFSLRAGGRTFSFGTKPGRLSTPPQQHQQQQQQQHHGPSSQARERAMTASSVSTATPPRLLDSDLKLNGEDDDNFSNMFEGFGKRKSALLQSNPGNRSSKALPPDPPKEDRNANLPPINVDRSQEVEPSPLSWDSQTSRDGLMDTSHNQPTSQPVSPTSRRHVTPSDHTTGLTTAQRARNAQSPRDQGLKRGSVYAGRRVSSPVEDVDAKIVRESLLLYRKNTQQATSENTQVDAEEENPLFCSDEIMSSVRLASQLEERAASPPVPQNKVMTPAQFERYRQQQELTRQQNKALDSESSDASSDYDEEDEDEAEKNREAARQRRKQEAHLSVYRQQMMKVTGEQNPNPLGSPQTRSTVDRASSSTPNLTARMSTLGISTEKPDSGKSSDGDGDDDEDVPLGILAAHGFPNKNRPPTRLTSVSSIPNLRASASASPGSVYGDAAGTRSSLPAFARNLPKDPYFGASLVNPSRRESLAMGGGSPAYGGTPTSLPPGGLVGVIASEERARAMRRGSPNPQVSASSHGIPRPYSMANIGQMGPAGYWGMSGMMPPQQGMSPGEQAQLHISQQMTEIMQQQMQMMQQMMQMQGIPTGPQGHPNNNFLSATNMRPMSMASASSFNLPSVAPQVDQRTLSMLDPNMSRWNANRPLSMFPDGGPRPGTPHATPGYTPSIAPSERSNVGLASRYRPVSTVGQDHNNQMPRSSTFTSSTLKPWNDENQWPQSVTASPAQTSDRKSMSLATMTARPVQGQGSTPSRTDAGAVSDDDDDEGWAEMMKKREKKKSNWKLKNSTPALGDLLHMVH